VKRPAINPWEARNRALKVRRLTRLIDDMVSLLGLHASADGLLIAELVRGWGDGEWQSAAINIGADHVGVLTRLAVLRHYMEAQRRAG
jgi:hypothetical protein